MEDVVSFLKTLGLGRRPVNDPFLENSHKCCKVFERKGVTVEDEEELCHEQMKEFKCNACNATFHNLLEYELHYHDSHHFVCVECKKQRPSARLLEIHVQETHDNYFQVLAQRQPMYQCFVSECNVKFKDPIERRDHCREIHEFPKNYRFDNSMNTKPKISNNSETMEVEDSEQKKKKNPKVQFGKNNKQRTFTKQNFKLKEPTNLNTGESKVNSNFTPTTMFIPRQVQQKKKEAVKNVLESDSLMDLGESLPKI